MKQQVFVAVLAFFFLCASVVVAQTDPQAPIVGSGSASDVERLEGAIDTIPLDDSGNIDNEKLNSSILFVNSKAAERINGINTWLDDNLTWLHIIFRMPPAISWPFFWNLLLMAYGLTHLVFNAIQNIVFVNDERYRRLVGFVIWVLLITVNLFVVLAIGITAAFSYFWNTLLPWGVWIAVLLTIVFGLLMMAFPALIPALFRVITRILAPLFGWNVGDTKEEVALKRTVKKAETINERSEESLAKMQSFEDGAGI